MAIIFTEIITTADVAPTGIGDMPEKKKRKQVQEDFADDLAGVVDVSKLKNAPKGRVKFVKSMHGKKIPVKNDYMIAVVDEPFLLKAQQVIGTQLQPERLTKVFGIKIPIPHEGSVQLPLKNGSSVVFGPTTVTIPGGKGMTYSLFAPRPKDILSVLDAVASAGLSEEV